MRQNRSIPRCTVIPELAYPNVTDAAGWLIAAFGFTLRLGIGDHRAQLNVGDGAMVVTQRLSDDAAESGGGTPRRADAAHSVLVRVTDVRAHHDRAKAHGARVLRAPADYPYGERQYTVEDPGGHVWTFTESIADVAPEDWGGTPGQL